MERPSGPLPPLPRHRKDSRASLPRVRGSILHGPQSFRDHLVAAMRREPITWVGDLSEIDEDGQQRGHTAGNTPPTPWPKWGLLALVFIATLFLAAIPVAAEIPPAVQPTPTNPPTNRADQAADQAAHQAADQAADPGADDPGADDPGSRPPGADDPGADDPGADDPGADDLRSRRPRSRRPQEPTTQEPTTSGADDPQADDPGADDPRSRRPRSRRPRSRRPKGADRRSRHTRWSRRGVSDCHAMLSVAYLKFDLSNVVQCTWQP